MHVVLKPFARAIDEWGVKTEDLVPGDERDFGSATAGLLAEGYIGPIQDEAVKEAGDEPAPVKRGPGRPRKVT